jgi:hypothetical protein
MTMIYDLDKGAKNIRSYRHNASTAMSQLLLPELKPSKKLNLLKNKQIEKLRLLENKNQEAREKT